jgi:hypothetical protein
LPKIITARRRESEADQAREYVKTHILLPSSLIGMVFMVAGVLALVHQFMSLSFGWQHFVETSGLLMSGMLVGWAHSRYQRYVLREYPAFFAARMKLFSRGPLKRPKRETPEQSLDHRGRGWIPLAYVVGILALLGVSFTVATYGHLYFVAAFFMPWVGYFWAKMFCWRKVLQ